MKKYFLSILFCSLNLICFAQLNDIRLNFVPLVLSNRKTLTDYKNNDYTYNLTKIKSYEFGASYARIFKNDYFLKILYFAEYYNYMQPSNIIDTPYIYKYNNQIQYINHKIALEGGKKLSYKFIDFFVGCGLKYKYSEPNTLYFHYDMDSITDNSFISSRDDIFTNPSSHIIGIYLNTSLYFRLYKILYLGIELNNGLTYSMAKGEHTYTMNLYDSNHLLNKQTIEQDYINAKIFANDVFDLKFGLRFVFPDFKKKLK